MTNVNKQIYINASDVSACIGENWWKSPEDVVGECWDRCNHGGAVNSKSYILDDNTTDNLVATHGTKEQQNQLAVSRATRKKQSEAIKEQIKDHVTSLKDTLQDNAVKRADVKASGLDAKAQKQRLTEIQVKETASLHTTAAAIGTLDRKQTNAVLAEAQVNKDVVETILEKAVIAPTAAKATTHEKKSLDVLADIVTTPTELKAIQQATKKHVNTERGIRGESQIISDYEKARRVTVTNRNDKLHYIDIPVPHGIPIKIGGRTDGFVQATNTLVEVKRRRNGFRGFPKYEKIQCEVYMHMLKIDKCTHVEDFNGQQRTTEYSSDPKLWDTIVEKLGEFKEFYETRFREMDDQVTRQIISGVLTDLEQGLPVEHSNHDESGESTDEDDESGESTDEDDESGESTDEDHESGESSDEGVAS